MCLDEWLILGLFLVIIGDVIILLVELNRRARPRWI
jgi:hypothetical protein